MLGRYQPKKLIIYSRNELKQYAMAQEFPDSKFDYMRYFIGDVSDRNRLAMAMGGMDYVLRAATLKQAPAAENNLGVKPTGAGADAIR